MTMRAAGPHGGPEDDGPDRGDDAALEDLDRDVEGRHGEPQVDPDAPGRTLVDPGAPAVEPNEPG
jgi:hypothetical protein